MEEQLKRMADLLELILAELRNGGRPKVGVVEGDTKQPAPLTVDDAPVRG